MATQMCNILYNPVSSMNCACPSGHELRFNVTDMFNKTFFSHLKYHNAK